MTTPATLNFLIRDGLDIDIAGCLSLDHSYETDYVWQMHIHGEDGQQWEILFKRERLPRTMAISLGADEQRLRAALPTEQCLLIATKRDEPDVLGYLAMYNDQVHHFGLIHDLMVSLPFRRHGIGTRLVNAARQWAKEHGLSRLTIETQTKNYPGIAFCQQAGFTFCGFNDRYFPNQDIAVFFSLSLR
jgi:GNAT superfamily N-acetyltransferase